MQSLTIRTDKREQMLDVTHTVCRLVQDKGWGNGALLLFCPHTTGALTVNEAADPDVARDMTVNMGRIIPRHGDYRHAEGNSDAHIKTSLFGPSLMLIVENGEVRLGTWQGIYFCEWDGPRTRTLWAQWLPGAAD